MVHPETMHRLFVALSDEGVEYVLVGAVALDVLGIGRLTQDIDLFVDPTGANVERLRRALRSVWEDPEIDEIRAEDLAGAYPVIRYVAPDGSQIDLMARLGDVLTFDDLEATDHRYGDVVVRVATPQTMHRMKRDTARLQDAADARKLEEKFDLGE